MRPQPPPDGRQPISRSELMTATLAADNLLEQLGLETYRFAVEPRGERWDVQVEFSRNGLWTTLVLPVHHDDLVASARDEALRRTILESWRAELDAAAPASLH